MGTPRMRYLDNLKVVLIALIIVLHAVLGYVGLFEAWTYTEMRETTLHPVVEMVLLVLLSPFGFFLIALLFLVAGLLTPGSHDRKGGRQFVVDRLLRLGIPFAVYVFLVQPVLVYAVAHPFGDATGTFGEEYLRQVDTGPLWFVGVLLLYSLAYAAWRRLRPRAPGPSRPPTTRTLVVSALVVAPTSFAVRLVYPYGGESGVTDLNFWEWPACIAVFVLGVRAARCDWVHRVPPHLVRLGRRLTAVAVVAMTALLYAVGSRDVVEEMLGGWTWWAAAFACIEAVLVVFGPVWLLDLARRRLGQALPWVSSSAGAPTARSCCRPSSCWGSPPRCGRCRSRRRRRRCWWPPGRWSPRSGPRGSSSTRCRARRGSCEASRAGCGSCRGTPRRPTPPTTP
jgi:hypothetical protein